MNYAEFRHSEAKDVSAALDDDTGTDPTALSMAVSNAMRRIHDLEQQIRSLRQALQDVLDPFHQGQINVRPEAAGYVQSAVDAGEEALISGASHQIQLPRD